MIGVGAFTGPLVCCLTWDVPKSSEIPSTRKEHKTVKTEGKTTKTALGKRHRSACEWLTKHWAVQRQQATMKYVLHSEDLPCGGTQTSYVRTESPRSLLTRLSTFE